MALVSVSIAGATNNPINLTYQSNTGAGVAQALANSIQRLVGSGALTVANAGGRSTPPAGASGGVYIVPSTGGGAYTAPDGYPVLIDDATGPVTVTGGASGVPYSILGGSGGLTLNAGSSTVGGQILLGGGNNSLTGAGGLNGDWRIWTGNSQNFGPQSFTPNPTSGSETITLGTGTSTVDAGSGDTVNAGAGNVRAWFNGGTGGASYFIGSGAASINGNNSTGLRITPGANGTGGGSYTLGTGGNGYVQAGGGNSTLSAAGNNDQVLSSTLAGANQKLFANGGSNVVASAALEDRTATSEIWGGSGSTETLQAGAGKDTVIAGGGTDSIILGNSTQQQELWFIKSHTNGANDIVDNFNLAQDKLTFSGYISGPTVTSATGATLVVSLADNTTITFTNLKTGDFAPINKVIA